jgi:hypothetical protein
MQHVIDELKKALPPVFAGTSLGELTGGAIHWPTIQNRRALRQIPDECFVRSGTRVLVLRDLFLEWWSTTLSAARAPETTGGKPEQSPTGLNDRLCPRCQARLLGDSRAGFDNRREVQ